MAELNYPGDNHKPQSRKYNVQSHRGRCRGFIGGKEFSTFEKFEVRGIRSNDEWVLPIWSLFWSQCCAMERFYISDNHNYNNMATGIHVHAYSCPTVCDPTECSPPGSSVHGTLQARILGWVAISSFPPPGVGLSTPGIGPHLLHLLHWQVDSFTTWAMYWHVKRSPQWSCGH